MKRRKFVQHLGMGTLALGMGRSAAIASMPQTPSHLITLSFDDGFKKSFLEAAAIHENHGLSGCFNVIASAHSTRIC